MSNTLLPNTPNENNTLDNINPLEVARFLTAFAECSREMQDIVLEMSTIISDEGSDDDERRVACDAMVQALFPGTAADVLEIYHERMHSPEARQVAAGLRAEEKSFAERVRKLMREKNVTQEQLAAAAGISQPAVSNILTRHCRPQRRTVMRFAEALGTTPQDLWPTFNRES